MSDIPNLKRKYPQGASGVSSKRSREETDERADDVVFASNVTFSSLQVLKIQSPSSRKKDYGEKWDDILSHNLPVLPGENSSVHGNKREKRSSKQSTACGSGETEGEYVATILTSLQDSSPEWKSSQGTTKNTSSLSPSIHHAALSGASSSFSKSSPSTTVRESTSSKSKLQKEGLQQATHRIVKFLMAKGSANFKDIVEELGIDYRRSYDILNVLLTTPLVNKANDKRANNVPYLFCDGVPRSMDTNVDSLYEDIEEKGAEVTALQSRIQQLEFEIQRLNQSKLP